jgi:hypothetical protein
MPMSTTLFAVSAEKLAELKKKPDGIMKLDSKDTFSTYLWTSIPYFLAPEDFDDEGDDEDDEDGGSELGSVLSGTDSVDCSRLENGSFYVFEPADVANFSTLLGDVDVAEIKQRVLDAELEEVCDGEVWEELEQQDLSEPKEVAKAVVEDLKRLKKFYADIAKKKLALVGYTS